MKRKIEVIQNNNKKLKINDKNKIDYNIYSNIIYSFFKKYCKNRYILKNKVSLTGLKLKEIPYKYLVVIDQYFFDIRELYNISNYKNPYTNLNFKYNIKMYIKNIIKKNKLELESHKLKYLCYNKENLSILIVKVSNILMKNDIYFDSKNFLNFNEKILYFFLLDLKNNRLTCRYIDIFLLNKIKLNDISVNNKKILILNKIYEIINIKDKHQDTRCLL